MRICRKSRHNGSSRLRVSDCTEASASLYSLVETVKANSLEPWAYLERVFELIPRAETIEDLDALLPRRIRLRNDGDNRAFAIESLSLHKDETKRHALLEDARNDLRKGWELDPAFGEAMAMIGVAEAFLGNCERAPASFESAD